MTVYPQETAGYGTDSCPITKIPCQDSELNLTDSTLYARYAKMNSNYEKKCASTLLPKHPLNTLHLYFLNIFFLPP